MKKKNVFHVWKTTDKQDVGVLGGCWKPKTIKKNAEALSGRGGKCVSLSADVKKEQFEFSQDENLHSQIA